MGFAEGYNSLLFKDILDVVSEEALIEYYTGINQIPCVTNSPLRKDNHPSFGLIYLDNGIYYKDFTTGDRGFTADLLKAKLNINSLNELRDRVLKDLPSIKEIDKYIIKQNKSTYYAKNKINNSPKTTLKNLQVKVRSWKDYDLEFWLKYGITKKWLEFGKVYPISHIQIGEKTFPSEKYAYCYVEYKDNLPTLKVYQPFSSKLKWLNNHGSSVWDLWSQALNSKSNELIITSSRKDALCLWENIGIPSVSLQAEGYLPKPYVVSILQEKFSTIYCLYDNDYDKENNYGREYGKKISNLYNFKQIEIPQEYLSKDPSDLYKNQGKEVFIEVIKSIISNK
jgi:hypothetical protein